MRSIYAVKHDCMSLPVYKITRIVTSHRNLWLMLTSKDMSMVRNDHARDFNKILWALKIHPKWKLFLRKLLHNGIAIRINLGRRGLQVSLMCDICCNMEEDVQHLFRFCTFAQQTWRVEILISTQKKLRHVL